MLKCPWVAGHESQESRVSEGEEAISGSRYPSHLMPQERWTSQTPCLPLLPLISVAASPAAPCGLALATPHGFCLVLSPWGAPGFWATLLHALLHT